ncbi:MAG: Hsp20/alpha crystallin family protein [Gemmatimonadaceae bacterium]|nr:Hsp20/alpha crystallin family protein [Gemmatimonadaceae bacterium]
MSIYRFAMPSLLQTTFPSSGLRTEMQRALNEVQSASTADVTPQVDARESASGFTLEFDLPGVSADSVEVLAEDGVLTVRATRSQRELAEGEQAVFTERVAGNYLRRFRLPKSADLGAIQASYANGVLTVRVAKVAPAQARKIVVEVGA